MVGWNVEATTRAARWHTPCHSRHARSRDLRCSAVGDPRASASDSDIADTLLRPPPRYSMHGTGVVPVARGGGGRARGAGDAVPPADVHLHAPAARARDWGPGHARGVDGLPAPGCDTHRRRGVHAGRCHPGHPGAGARCHTHRRCAVSPRRVVLPLERHRRRRRRRVSRGGLWREDGEMARGEMSIHGYFPPRLARAPATHLSRQCHGHAPAWASGGGGECTPQQQHHANQRPRLHLLPHTAATRA